MELFFIDLKLKITPILAFVIFAYLSI